MSAPPILTLKDYSVSCATVEGNLRVLENIDLAIGPGEVVGLVGESGSGKSTLAFAIMRALRGNIWDETGEILLGTRLLTGLDEASLANIRGKRIAMVFQDPGSSLNPTLTLGEHFVQVLERHRQLSPPEIRQEIQRLLILVDLPDPDIMAKKYLHEVSGGEKQRAVIALAFACNPELILFDEPTSALDATTAVTILDLFRALQERTGVAALFISHDLGVVREIAHRVCVIYAGRLVEVASIARLFSAPRHPYTRALLASLPRPAVGTRIAPLMAIPGALPDRTKPIEGCNFAARCAHVTQACRTERPELTDDPQHAVACPYWQTIDAAQPSRLQTGQALGSNPRVTLAVEDLSVQISRPGGFARLLGRQPPTIHAVNKVSLVLHAGETLGMVGESGCGKSTLAHALVGLRHFTGRLVSGDRPIPSLKAIDRQYRQRVQIIFQNPDRSLNPRQTIAAILSRPLRLYHATRHAQLNQTIAALLARVNLPKEFAQRYPHELSGGEKQRVAIARALAAEPEVIVCDEITSGLDASVQASIVNLLKEIQAEHTVSYLFITHDLNLLRHIADRVVVMYLGEIVEARNASEIGAPPYHPYTEALLSCAPVLDPDLTLRRVRLEGNLPSRTGALAGCSFASRCPRNLGKICTSERPQFIQMSQDHRILCHIEPDGLRAVPPIWNAGTANSQP